MKKRGIPEKKDMQKGTLQKKSILGHKRDPERHAYAKVHPRKQEASRKTRLSKSASSDTKGIRKDTFNQKCILGHKRHPERSV